LASTAQGKMTGFSHKEAQKQFDFVPFMASLVSFCGFT
jgi:hypothetical protein